MAFFDLSATIDFIISFDIRTDCKMINNAIQIQSSIGIILSHRVSYKGIYYG